MGHNSFVILIGLFISLNLNAQFSDSFIAVRYDSIESSNSLGIEGINGIILSGARPTEINDSRKLNNIEYIIYSGNDWDYNTQELPKSWFKFKNLKAILIENVTYETEIINNTILKKPRLFIANMNACNTVFTSSSPDSVYFKTYIIKFTRNPKLPYNAELNQLAEKGKFSHLDSLNILSKFIANELKILEMNDELKNRSHPWTNDNYKSDSVKLYIIQESMTSVFTTHFLFNFKDPEMLNSAFKPDFLDSQGFAYFLNYQVKAGNFSYLNEHFKNRLHEIFAMLAIMNEEEMSKDASQISFFCQYYNLLYSQSLKGYFDPETIRMMNFLKEMVCK